MSYVVDIIGGRAPEAYEVALTVRDDLAEAREVRLEAAKDVIFEPPSAQMSELHRRLTSRYPCICDDPDGPWSDGPLINNFGHDYATVGIRYSRVEEVLPFLIHTAQQMGFWVLDAQNEALHLPTGSIRRALSLEPASPEKRWWQIWK